MRQHPDEPVFGPAAGDSPGWYPSAGGFTGASDAGGHTPHRSPQPTPGTSGGYPPVESLPPLQHVPSTSGRHTFEQGKKRRGPLIGPLAGAVGLAVLAATAVFAFTGVAGCGDDPLTLGVAATPGIAPVVEDAAKRFNDRDSKIDGRCVRARVTKQGSSSVAALLTGRGLPSPGSRTPDAWVPDTSLWASTVLASPEGARTLSLTRTSVASTPVVVGVPKAMASSVGSAPSWNALLRAVTGGGGVSDDPPIPEGSVRLVVPDPSRDGTGLSSLMIVNTLLADSPDRAETLTAFVRAASEASVTNATAQFTKSGTGRRPLALVSEQELWKHNRDFPDSPATALYPSEGTMALDHPYAVVTRDETRRRAAALFESELRSGETRAKAHSLGFRAADGDAPQGFGPDLGVLPARPVAMPAPGAAEVAKVVQAWMQLAQGMRVLLLTDVSGSMLEEVTPGVNRIEALARMLQGGIGALSDDTELGSWVFSTDMDGRKPYKVITQPGPLGERVGSSTRRDQLLSHLAGMKPKPNGDTGLYETVIAAYEYMLKTYKPEFGHSITLFTDGRNDHPGSDLTLARTIARLKELQDPNKLVVVNMIGYGDGVSRSELDQIAKATRGAVAIAHEPEDIQKIITRLVSRRITERD